MPNAIAVHTVGSFETWVSKTNRERLFPEVCKAYRLYRLGDSNKVAVFMEGVDLDRLGTMLSSPAATAAEAEDTVQEPIELFVEIEGGR